jgi:hypothetical protein
MVAMSRFIDERGRIFGKVNVVDILVLLVIVAVIVFAVMRMTGSSSQTVLVTVVYTVEQVRAPTVQAVTAQLEAEGIVTDDTGTVLGRMQAAEVLPTEVEYLTSSDTLEKFESPVFSNINITVAGQGHISNGGARIGSVPVLVGKKVTIRGATFEVVTTITGVSF